MHSERAMRTLEIIDVRANLDAIGQRKVIGHIPIPCAKQTSCLILKIERKTFCSIDHKILKSMRMKLTMYSHGK